MKLVQLLALSALVLFTAIGAHADGVSTDDARIIISGDPPPGSCTTNGLGTFMINPHGNGGGIFTNCLNTTGENWSGLEIIGKTKVSKDNIGFGSGVLPFPCNGEPVAAEPMDLFSTCTIISQSGHSVTFELTGGIILAGSSFSIDLSDDGDNMGAGKGGWEGQLKITPLVVAAPEPGAMAMLLTGLGAIWFWRRRAFIASV
jgi:hypothetical protein